MGLFEWLGIKRGDGRRRAAEAKELSGDLAAAVELYLEAELPDDAARVLLLRADAERAPEKRIAFCAAAARTAASAELQRAAHARKALLSFDLLRARGASAMRSEVLAVAHELEAVLELERAADAYALAEDAESEVRVLTAAGAIDRLEERLRVSMVKARGERELSALLRTIGDLDRVAERREALALAEAFLAGRGIGAGGAERRPGVPSGGAGIGAESAEARPEARYVDPGDERVADVARAIRARLLSKPVVDLETDRGAARYALGDEVTIGRGEATITVAARAVSRTHVRIRRGAGGVELEDLGTRNGTTLAGARISRPIAVGSGVRVLLGGEVPCALSTSGAGCVIELFGERYIAPLGDLAVGPWTVRFERTAAGDFVVLHTPSGAPPPFLGDYQLAASVELCVGDAISAARRGPAVLRLLPAARDGAAASAPPLGAGSGSARP